MFRLNKDIEYALIALTEISHATNKPVSVKDVTDKYHLPYKLTARVLNSLKNAKLLQSTQGKNGGYHLNKKAENITINEIQAALYGNEKIVPCLDEQLECLRTGSCNIQPSVQYLQSRLNSVLGSISLLELTNRDKLHTQKR
jgi:Rrf2 family protein